MCGLAGIFQPAASADGSTVLERLARRGPDATGEWHDARCVLYHTRLSIIDLDDRSSQPMVSDDGRFVLAYNGEIFNYRELRSVLQDRGCRFRTEGDTEVLLALLSTSDDLRCLRQIRGMFAFALYDTHLGTLTLGRDAFGIKPLLYASRGTELVFASTSDALTSLGIAPEFDGGYLVDYLQFGHGVLGRAALAGVRHLAPGTCVIADGRGTRSSRWIDLRDPSAEHERSALEGAAILEASIQRHTVADVPVGVFLSGGIDSAVVAGTMARSGQEVRSYSVAFAEGRLDESAAARELSRRFGTKHREISFSFGDVPRLFDALLDAFDEPFGDGAALPTLAVSELAAREVRVVLSGEGGDELFGGYRRYLLHRWWMGLPKVARQAVHLGVRPRWQRARRLLEPTSYAEAYVRWLDFGVVGSDGSPYAPHLDRIRAAQGPERELWSLLVGDLTGWLVDTYLVKLDRAAMYHSLEGRVPLLDLDVFDLASSLRDRDRITNPRVGKNFLRAFASELAGSEHVNRPKRGFVVPLPGIMESGVLDATLAPVFADARATGGWAARLAGAAEDTVGQPGMMPASRWWYLVVLLAWAHRRDMLGSLDALDDVDAPGWPTRARSDVRLRTS